MTHQESPDALTRGLRAVADDDDSLRASSAVGMRLIAEVHGIAQTRRRRRMVFSAGSAAAIVAAIVLLAGPRRVADELRGTRPTSPEIRAGSDAPVISRELVTEFFPLAYGNVPVRGGYVVRMQVSREALASFVGAAALESNNGSGQLLADVVVGDDGLARAVRFVRMVTDRDPADAGLHGQEQTP